MSGSLTGRRRHVAFQGSTCASSSASRNGVLLDHYVDRMSELGVQVGRDSVIRAFEIIEGFRRIRADCANGDLQNTDLGLRLVEAQAAA